MKKIFFAPIVSLVVVIGILLTSCERKNESKQSPKPTSIADNNIKPDARKKWEASPDGLKYKEWEVSAEGKKVHSTHDKIKKYLKDFTTMDAVVTSINFKGENEKSSGPNWIIVKINGEEYMMQYISKDFEKLKNLKVNDKIIVKSHSAGYSTNHPYLIVSGDYIEQNGKVLFKREFNTKNGC